jgi:hypothetical protein
MGMRKNKSTALPDTSSAFGWGPKGRWFKSSRPDLSPLIAVCTAARTRKAEAK